ncbi:origin recognition complex subunit 2-domain-containing protein [Pholiota molesta]|nr:origin recognition complex subunit 2-domain-containing protein [Pholiota molesta]
MPRHLPSFAQEPEIFSEEEDQEDAELSDESDHSEDIDNHASGSPQKGKGKARDLVEQSVIIVQTTFDAYFTYNKPGRVQTSSNRNIQMLLAPYPKGHPPFCRQCCRARTGTHIFAFYCRTKRRLQYLCYGLGSKRRLLNQFATSHCSKHGHVVVVNGFQPEFTLKDMLNSIEEIPGIQDLEFPSANVEKQARRIYEFFAKATQQVDLYLIIHNIDAAPFRAAKSKSILSLLAHNPRIHVIASIDHINAPLLWSSSEIFSRKPDEVQADTTTPSRGFSWLWHDLTTLVPYDFELAYADRASLSGAHTGGARRKADTLAAQNATAMTETAASHILASVTQKAQKLFITLGNIQLENISNAEDGASADLQQFGVTYEFLSTMAKENFYAHNDTALRALLGEFRDHNLIVSAPATMGSGETLWIPMRKERLANVLRELQK